MVCARHRRPTGLGPDPPIHVMVRQTASWAGEPVDHDGKDRDEDRDEVSGGNREKAR